MYKFILLGLVLLFVTTPAQAEDYYRLRVSREENNMYSVDGTKLVIQTQLCMELVLAQPAVLVWERPGSWNNKLVFLDREGKSRRACRVKRLLVETEP